MALRILYKELLCFHKFIVKLKSHKLIVGVAKCCRVSSLKGEGWIYLTGDLERAAGLLEEDVNQDGCSGLRAHDLKFSLYFLLIMQMLK